MAGSAAQAAVYTRLAPRRLARLDHPTRADWECPFNLDAGVRYHGEDFTVSVQYVGQTLTEKQGDWQGDAMRIDRAVIARSGAWVGRSRSTSIAGKCKLEPAPESS